MGGDEQDKSSSSVQSPVRSASVRMSSGSGLQHTSSAKMKKMSSGKSSKRLPSLRPFASPGQESPAPEFSRKANGRGMASAKSARGMQRMSDVALAPAVDSSVAQAAEKRGSEKVMDIVTKHGEDELMETIPEAHKSGAKKLVRSSSLQRFQEMVFQRGAPSHDDEQHGGEHTKTQSDRPANTEKPARLPSLRNLAGSSSAASGDNSNLVRSLSQLKLFEKEHEEKSEEEDHQQTLVRTASRLDLAEDQVRVIRRGNSAIAIPKPDAAVLIAAKRERNLMGMEVDARGSVALVKNTGFSMKYKKMLRDEVPEPPLYLSTYANGDWWVDVFSLYHNALRREMQDMYYMLTSMHKRVLTLGHEDVNSFFEWFDVFVMIVEWYFKVEEIALFPWVEERLEMPEELQKMQRLQLKAQVVEIVKTVDDCFGKFDYLPAGEVLPALVEGVGTFAPMLVGYFRRIEKQVCPLIKEAFTEADKQRLDVRCIETLWNSDESGILLECLARPLRNEETRKEFRRSYLEVRNRTSGSINAAKKKMAFVKNKKEFYTDHQRIVDEFYNRWQSAFEEAEREEYMT
uniref:Uncharacterized protein n=1 Tax=Erythrolobus australicus TaxID=1077150 RepID=A0A7S1TMT3_9RHOD|mmetsp:Transcript_827/g.2259  ORF Transcript_827/g.2259 Transcript_827/m.2259 type:complete len:572 (+) Transcript_827:137-1852(+)|eukprot:CAMPEP_0185835202 /NCGR_PEP_ID=MMETSP1353-20130828/7244_1 /TAXON_ID=1077150 /ORGANISM="Erythrolobus australicus, Strain CCMP3124" /LENGTH=571 /DNA_ID=CAMNT_0028533783 /DNA_START=133 /DNA_END=1848 /DNA_ORIENTATION=-